MRLGFMLALVLTVGCAADVDGDGSNEKEDCDDNNATVSPNFSEICDGIDNDCDGEIDEDVTEVFYLDSDNDGYGLESVSINDCETDEGNPPDGYVIDNTDCDDTNAFSYPGADELCDEEDNDCDGTVDDGATTVYYADADGDGYGADKYTSDDCELPSGFAEVGGDCDDKNADVNPDAEEICDGIDNDCAGDADGDDDQATDALTWYFDSDDDGYGIEEKTLSACEQPGNYAAVSGDCDDNNDAVNPDVIELCDADDVDDDCDGHADDDDVDIFGQDPLSPDLSSGASVWYGDADSDGYGGATFSLVACDAPSSYVDNGDDCDDLDDEINPDATEICDDIDNDCDTLIDDGDNDVSFVDENGETVLWYIDVDGDGYGSDAYTVQQCDEPAGYVATDTGSLDCNDQNSLINPGEEETCNDGLDNNCDGSPTPCALEDEIAYDDADFVIRGDVGDDSSDNGDQIGRSLVVGDLNNDGNDDLLVGAIGINGDNTDDGGVYIFYGPFDDASQEAASDADAVFFGGDDADNAGYAVTAIDLDGDNYDDIVVTSYGQDYLEVFDTGDIQTDNVGVVYVIYGSATEFTGEYALADDSDASFVGTDEDEHFGCALSNAGDTNGDTYDDLVIGNCIDNNLGAAYLLYGSSSRFETEINVYDQLITETDGYASWAGESSNSYTGTSVSGIGDFDGDGLTDMAIGAYGHDVEVSSSTTYADAGAAFVILGDGTEHVGELEVENASAYFYGENAYDNAGFAVAGLGDVDGDGYDDFVVGAPEYDRDLSSSSSGIGYVLFGSGTDLGELSTTTSVLGESQYDDLGGGVGEVGDIDADGYADLVFGAPKVSIETDSGTASNIGAAYLFYGPISGQLEAADDADAKFTGNPNGSGEFGLNFAGAGDLDADGELDLIVGARTDDKDGTSESTDVGAIYVFTGGGL